MARAYSLDLRERVVAAVETGGLSCDRVAVHFGVASAWRSGGSSVYGPPAARRRARSAAISPARSLGRTGLASVADQGGGPDLARAGGGTRRTRPEGGLSFGLTLCPRREAELQKNSVGCRSDRPDVARRRAQWKEYQDRVDPTRLIFIDETWAKTNMARLRGWAPRGAA